MGGKNILIKLYFYHITYYNRKYYSFNVNSLKTDALDDSFRID